MGEGQMNNSDEKINNEVIPTQFDSTVPTKITTWTKIKNFLFQEVKIELTPKEYEILFYLVNNEGIVVSRENLLTNVWGYDYFGDDDKKVLISIRPEWLCKILNGEKTVEVRKVILKEMLNGK